MKRRWAGAARAVGPVQWQMGMVEAPHSEAYRDGRRVLVFLPWGIGDLVMQRPLLAAIRRAVPRGSVVAIGARPAVELLAEGELADEVGDYQSLGAVHYGIAESAAIDDAVREWLGAHGPFDFIFNSAHAPQAVRHAAWRAGAETIEMDFDRQYAALVREEGCQRAWLEAASAGWKMPMDTATHLRLVPPGTAQREAEAFFEEHGLEGHLAAISPVASMGLKQWPRERFARIADWLIEVMGPPVLLFQGDQDDAGDAVLACMRRGHDIIRVGAHHLLTVAAMIERTRVLVCNDTGLLHMAAAVGTPVVGIYGPTSPEIYRPRVPWAIALGGREPECPHRRRHALDVAGCWLPGRCLIGPESCINVVGEEAVQLAVQRLVPITAQRGPGLRQQTNTGAERSRAGVEETVARSRGQRL